MQNNFYWLIKLAFVALLRFSRSLACVAKVFDGAKCASLNNQPCLIIPTLIDLDPDEYNQRLCHYPFTIKLNRCNGSCNAPRIFRVKLCFKQNRKFKFKFKMLINIIIIIINYYFLY